MFFLLIVTILSLSVSLLFLNSCQKDSDYESVDKKIAISSEFEDFVIASVDFQQAMNVFEREMRKVDLVNADNDGHSTRNGDPIFYVAHTHQSGHTPGEADLAIAAMYPGLKQGIYYDGSIEFYNWQ